MWRPITPRMPAVEHRVRGIGFRVLSHVGAFVAVLAVLGAILAIDRHGDRQKQAQLLVSQIESRISLDQSLPWDADPKGADVPPEQVLAALAVGRRGTESKLLQLREIDPQTRPLLALASQNAEILERQVGVVQSGDDARSNEASDEAFAVFEELRRELDVAGLRFSKAAESAYRYTLAGTAALMFALYGAFALTLALLRRAQRQRAAQDERLRQSQKMEAVGQLAGGVAHDFNNLLTAILGYSDLALSRIDETADPGLRADIEEIVKSGERATGLTRQLLTVSRRQTLQSTVFDLNEAVSGTERLLGRLLGTHVIMSSTLDPGDCSILADHGQIEQVIMNLALNARDAMPAGGFLRIETDSVDLSAAEAGRRFQAPAGEYVVLRVADNGSGMDAATRGRAFEPFFTTKTLGEGTGLGLATVYGIVAQSGGYIALESEPGIGTTFEVLLPRLATLALIDLPALPPAPRGGTERILLVEDEAVVRDLTRTILAREGYEVIVAADGDEALELSSEQAFDLLITDMVMPKMSGKTVAGLLSSDRPGLPVIFISGYAYEVIQGGLGETETFLQKPYSSQELALAVRASLDHGTPRAA